MTFGEALSELNKGEALHREAWSSDACVVKAENNLELHVSAGKGMWSPQVDDLFADDWMIIRH